MTKEIDIYTDEYAIPEEVERQRMKDRYYCKKCTSRIKTLYPGKCKPYNIFCCAIDLSRDGNL